MFRPGWHAPAVGPTRADARVRVVKPPIGATYDLDGFAQALLDMDARKTLGKSVVHVR